MFEKGKAFEKHSKLKISQNNSPEKKMPVFDITPLLEEDKAMKGLDVPFRFGKSFEVNITIKDGKWVKTDSIEVWSLKISSPKAYSLNFIFSELYLPKGAELYIFNEDGSMIYGPVTEKQNLHGRTYLTDIIQGESVFIQLSVPITSSEMPKLVIQNVVHGYKSIFAPVQDPGYGQSQNCTDDVACYVNWSNESDGVVQILLSSGDELCSGALLNNTAQDFRPYIFTAFHCIDIGNPNINHYPPYSYDPNEQNGNLEQDEIEEAEEWLVRFRFRHTTCSGSTIANVVTYDDTQFRAAWHPTDFALVELENNIINDINSIGQKVWLGWDRTGATPSSGVGIHHPSGDIMKLSIENNQFSTSNWLNGLNNSHWLVNFDEGVVEHASSGSPIFDQNKRIVGQLSGNQNYNTNQSYCDQPRAEYGKFDLSWNGGGNANNQLSHWLQPTGAPTETTLNSIRQPTPVYSNINETLCSNSNFSVTSLAPGYTIHHWTGNNVSFPNGTTSNPVLVSLGSQGVASVQAVLNIGGELYSLPQQSFWIGLPPYPVINSYTSYTWTTNYGTPAKKEYTIYTGQDIVFYDENVNNYGGLTNNFDRTWYIDSGGLSYNEYDYGTGGKMYIFNEPGVFRIQTSTEACGSTNISEPVFVVVIAEEYRMLVSPNPASGEATVELSIVSCGKKNNTIEWELEVFDQTQALKAKASKLKVNSTKVQTSDWKDGVYIVRAKIGDKILTEKLIVKH
ncbi:MAG: hypothetical protein A2066_19150 [Bacteroidetes bacterium GWB2_41_8]|nr:MAG: hypothetical protein A2066_19150 [Bacteroidetes bacterium GWB2_41_8]